MHKKLISLSATFQELRGNYYAMVVITFAFLACCLYVSPFYEIPQNDDWAYYLTIKSWLDTGVLTHNGWNDPTLVFQIYWGMLFVKFFGLSYSTLRLSTLVLAWAGTLALYFTLLELNINKALALLGSLLLIFNPVVLVLSYSFNTDVPYLSLIVIAQLFLLKSLRNNSFVFFTLTGIVLACAVMVRQNAIFVTVFSILYLIFFSSSNKKPIFCLALLTPSVITLSLHFNWMSHQDLQGWPFALNNPIVFLSPSTLLEKYFLLLRGILSGLYLLIDIPILLLPLLLSLFLHTPTTTAEKKMFVIFFLALFLLCGFSHSWGYGSWPYFSAYLTAKKGIFIQSGGQKLINYPASYIITLVSVIFVATLFSKTVFSLKQKSDYRSRYVWLFMLLGIAQLAPSLLLENIYDRYIVVLLPSLIIFITYILNLTHNSKKKSTIFMVVVFMLLSADLLRGYVAYVHARWQVANELVLHGISPSKIGSYFEWEGAHLYEDALYKYRRRPPFIMNEQSFPWKSFQTGECKIGSFDQYLFSIKYRAPLWLGSTTIGVRNDPECSAHLNNESFQK